MRRAVVVASVVGGCVSAVLGACATTRDGVIARTPYATLSVVSANGARSLRLDPVAGAKINARLRPTLQLSNGERLMFHADSLTADSSYFTQSPTVALTGNGPTSGTLMASVCPESARVCLRVRMDISLP